MVWTRRVADATLLLAPCLAVLGLLFVLPQALKLVIPGIVNSFISLFKDTSLVLIIGLFDLLEVGGRFTEGPYHYKPTGIRDLSGNFKLQVPFIPKGEYIPQLAVGVQDLGGNLHFLRTVYGVVTEDLWRFRISAGYGNRPDRMKGGFGGVEDKTFDWLYLLAEYDTREANVGLRLVTPEMFGIPVNLQVTVKSALNDRQGSPEYGFGFQMPLGLDHHNRQPMKQAAETVKDGSSHSGNDQTTAAIPPTPGASQQPLVGSTPLDEHRPALLRLRDRLAKDGFQYLRVGEFEGGLLVVEYENGRYTSNELDGMGVVAGIAAEMAPGTTVMLGRVEVTAVPLRLAPMVVARSRMPVTVSRWPAALPSWGCRRRAPWPSRSAARPGTRRPLPSPRPRPGRPRLLP